MKIRNKTIITKKMNFAMWLITFVIPKLRIPAIIAMINKINARFSIKTSDFVFFILQALMERCQKINLSIGFII